MKTWKDHPIKAGAIVAFVTLGWPFWLWLDANIVFTQAEASELIDAMNLREIDRVRALILEKERIIVQTKYRADLDNQAKDELIATYEEDIRLLKIREKCLNEGNINC